MAPELPDIRIHVHEPGDRSLDGILRLIEVAERDRPLNEVLAAMCDDVSHIADAQVVSAYARETAPDAEVYTLRANVGFPRHAVGRVRLELGEGIVGFVAACLRPVSVASASRDEHYKHIPGLGEERYPAMLAVPILRAGSAAGVLVMQRRRHRAFSTVEVALATAIAPLFSHAIERAATRDRERASTTAGAVRLRGVPVVGGAAMGRATVMPTLASLSRAAPSEVAAGDRDPLAAAIERLHRDLARARKRLGGARDSAASRAIGTLSLILDDGRFRERLFAACRADRPLSALCEVAREYARAPYRTAAGAGIEQMMTERAREIEDLCVLFYADLHGHRVLRAGTVVVAERLGAFTALCSIARGVTGFVVDADSEPSSPGTAIAAAAGVPLLSAVTGIFHWVRHGDLLVVDADGGGVRVNPPATAVAQFRRRKA